MSSPTDIVVPSEVEALVAVLRTLDVRLIRRGDDDTGMPYLWRGYLGNRAVNQEAGVFLHRFVSSDELEYHHHPWAYSHSFILAGRYAEDRVLSTDINHDEGTAVLDGSTRRTKVFGPGDVNVILGSTFHRVDLLTSEVWTLFVHGPRVQGWGFVPLNRFGEKVPLRLVEGHTRDRLSREAVG